MKPDFKKMFNLDALHDAMRPSPERKHQTPDELRKSAIDLARHMLEKSSDEIEQHDRLTIYMGLIMALAMVMATDEKMQNGKSVENNLYIFMDVAMDEIGIYQRAKGSACG